MKEMHNTKAMMKKLFLFTIKLPSRPSKIVILFYQKNYLDSSVFSTGFAIFPLRNI